jgi:hypothetical protein
LCNAMLPKIFSGSKCRIACFTTKSQLVFGRGSLLAFMFVDTMLS